MVAPTVVRTHKDQDERILRYWYADAHERGTLRPNYSHPLHALRRSVVDAKRWVPDWKPQLWQAPGLEYYHTGPGFPEIEGPAEDPRLIYFNDGHTSDDEGADEDKRDPEEDAELICRPRTTGNP